MKEYLATFNVTEGKIPMIKLVRQLTDLGLKESKEFVEAKFRSFEFDVVINVRVTADQLGRYLIQNAISPSNHAFSLSKVIELEVTEVLDLTALVGSN